MCAVDGLKWWPVGRNAIEKSKRGVGVVGETVGRERLGPLLVQGRTITHR